jgi:hypothetical protein
MAQLFRNISDNYNETSSNETSSKSHELAGESFEQPFSMRQLWILNSDRRTQESGKPAR